MKKALLLLNMGAPKDKEEVKLFLTNMFNDPRIIPAPKPIRWLVAKIVVAKRASLAAGNYEQIGGKSPIIEHTKKLISRLEQVVDADIFSLMRYTPPFAKEVLEQLQDYDAIYAIPLYPQHSSTTTLSSFDDLFLVAKKLKIEQKVKTISSFPSHPLYIKSIVQRIKEAMEGKNVNDFELLFSAHGLPQSVIDKGDLYQKHIRQTLFHIRKELLKDGLIFRKTHLAYQSRLGPVLWTKPYMDEKLKTLSGRNILVYPIAFCIDNSESEFELDIEYRHLAKEVGIKEYIVAKAPNENDSFVACLADLYESMQNG